MSSRKITSWLSPVASRSSLVSSFNNLVIDTDVTDHQYKPERINDDQKEKNVHYTYKYNKYLLVKRTGDGYYKNYPKKKKPCIELIKRIYGDNAVTVDSWQSFRGREEPTSKYHKGYQKCHICIEFPSHIVTLGKLATTTKTIASEEGSKYDIVKLIDHFTGKPHIKAVEQSRSTELVTFLRENGDEKAEDYTDNLLIRQCIDDKKITYKQRLRHVSIVYNDLKTLTLSARSFAARDLTEGYVEHLLEIGAGEFVPFVPSEEQCRYNNPTAHKRYRTLIATDIREHYVEPLIDKILSAGICYDGWRAFDELYIHGMRVILEDSTIMHIFVALVRPTEGGALGCVESFNLAYRQYFKTEQAFLDFLQKIASQTTDKASVNTGVNNGANVIIRRDVINNSNLPELICAIHCGHNSFKDVRDAFAVIQICVTDQLNTISFSHRGDIMKNFRKYCELIIFKNVKDKKDKLTPARWPDGSTTRMASHLFGSLEVTHESYDCWLLFLDDRSSNGNDTTVRLTALYQFEKLVNFKKVRVHYLLTDCLRIYSIFDKCGQIVGIDVTQLSEYRDKLTNNLELMKHRYGIFETYLFTEMITYENEQYLLYEYLLTHLDHHHLDIIRHKISQGVRTETIDGILRKILTISDNEKQNCKYLNLRDDIIEYWIKRINDRCFDHIIVVYIKKFDPRTWSLQYKLLGHIKFITEFLHKDIDSMVIYWPRIDAASATIGFIIVKKLYIEVFISNDNITLNVFGKYIISRYQHDFTMKHIRILYGNMLATLPTGMVLENWNSLSTNVWSKLAKSTTCESIDEYLVTKINGPPVCDYDARRPAAKATKNSRTRDIDVEKHINQPYLQSFFHQMKQNHDNQLAKIEKLQKYEIKSNNIDNIKALQHLVQNKSINRPKLLSKVKSTYQTNITSYFTFQRCLETPFQDVVLRNIRFTAYCLSFLSFDELTDAKIISSLFYITVFWVNYNHLSVHNFCLNAYAAFCPTEYQSYCYKLFVNDSLEYLHDNNLILCSQAPDIDVLPQNDMKYDSDDDMQVIPRDAIQKNQVAEQKDTEQKHDNDANDDIDDNDEAKAMIIDDDTLYATPQNDDDNDNSDSEDDLPIAQHALLQLQRKRIAINNDANDDNDDSDSEDDFPIAAQRQHNDNEVL